MYLIFYLILNLKKFYSLFKWLSFSITIEIDFARKRFVVAFKQFRVFKNCHLVTCTPKIFSRLPSVLTWVSFPNNFKKVVPSIFELRFMEMIFSTRYILLDSSSSLTRSSSLFFSESTVIVFWIKVSSGETSETNSWI